MSKELVRSLEIQKSPAQVVATTTQTVEKTESSSLKLKKAINSVELNKELTFPELPKNHLNRPHSASAGTTVSSYRELHLNDAIPKLNSYDCTFKRTPCYYGRISITPKSSEICRRPGRSNSLVVRLNSSKDNIFLTDKTSPTSIDSSDLLGTLYLQPTCGSIEKCQLRTKNRGYFKDEYSTEFGNRPDLIHKSRKSFHISSKNEFYNSLSRSREEVDIDPELSSISSFSMCKSTNVDPNFFSLLKPDRSQKSSTDAPSKANQSDCWETTEVDYKEKRYPKLDFTEGEYKEIYSIEEGIVPKVNETIYYQDNSILRQNPLPRVSKSSETLLKSIDNIIDEIKQIEPEIIEFKETSSKCNNYKYLEEVMMCALIKLDNIQTKNCLMIKEKRKNAIQFIQTNMEVLCTQLQVNKEKFEITKGNENINPSEITYDEPSQFNEKDTTNKSQLYQV